MLVASSHLDLPMRFARLSLSLAVTIALSAPLALHAQPVAPDSATPARNGASPAAVNQADALREAALRDDTAWQVLESLTTEVGPHEADDPSPSGCVAANPPRSWARTRNRCMSLRSAAAPAAA